MASFLASLADASRCAPADELCQRIHRLEPTLPIRPPFQDHRATPCLSDTVCLFYGARGAYGIVTPPMGVREGVNAFLSGYLPQSNLRFREHALSFKASADDPYEPSAEGGGRRGPTRYPAMAKALGGFTLRVEAGSFAPSEVLVLLGQNGTGKTTLLRLLSGDLAPDADGGGGGAAAADVEEEAAALELERAQRDASGGHRPRRRLPAEHAAGRRRVVGGAGRRACPQRVARRRRRQ